MITKNVLNIDSWMNVKENKFSFDGKPIVNVFFGEEGERKRYCGRFVWRMTNQALYDYSITLRESIEEFKIFSEKDLKEAWQEHLFSEALERYDNQKRS